MKKQIWGQLLSIDLIGCDKSALTDKKRLGMFCSELCREIKMKPFGKPMIKRFGTGYLEGYSAIQFIETSSITVHLDEKDRRAFIDIFSCKTFDHIKAKNFSSRFFKSKKAKCFNKYRR